MKMCKYAYIYIYIVLVYIYIYDIYDIRDDLDVTESTNTWWIIGRHTYIYIYIMGDFLQVYFF